MFGCEPIEGGPVSLVYEGWENLPSRLTTQNEALYLATRGFGQ